MRGIPTTARQPSTIQTRSPGIAGTLLDASLNFAGRVLPLHYELSRRSLWGHLPRRPVASPQGKKWLALSFDLDYQADTDALPGLLECVARFDVPMSLACIGKLVAQDTAPYREAVAAGHEIVNHTWSHPDNPVLNPDSEFWDLSPQAMHDEIVQAQDAFEELLGVRPAGFRSPHFKDAQRLLSVLEAIPEITYFSSALASKTPLAHPYFPVREPLVGEASLFFSSDNQRQNSDLLQIPLTPCPDHRWTPFCSYHAIRQPADPVKGAGMHTLDEFAHLWQVMLTQAEAEGFASVYFDPMDIMRDAETVSTFEGMLQYALDSGWTVTTLRQIEQAYRRHMLATA